MILPTLPDTAQLRAKSYLLSLWCLQEGKEIVWVTTWPPQLCGTQEGAHFLSSPSMNWIMDFRTGDWEESGTPDRVLGGCWRNMVHTVQWTPPRNHKLLGMHHSGSPQLVHKHPQLLAQLYTHMPPPCVQLHVCTSDNSSGETEWGPRAQRPHFDSYFFRQDSSLHDLPWIPKGRFKHTHVSACRYPSFYLMVA